MSGPFRVSVTLTLNTQSVREPSPNPRHTQSVRQSTHLHALALGRRSRVDVLARHVRPHEADGPDGGMVTDAIHHVVRAVDDVQHPRRQPGLRDMCNTTYA